MAKSSIWRNLFIPATLCWLTACTSILEGENEPIEQIAFTPPQWYAPMLAHDGKVQDLSQWWGRLQAPHLVDWIDAAQNTSPSVSTARVQVMAARAQLSQAQAALWPTVGAQAGLGRSNTSPLVPVSNNAQLGLQASWELGIWGQAKLLAEGVEASYEGSQASWHQARVLVAAQVAQSYYSLAHCYDQLNIIAKDKGSRAVTLDNATVLERAGLMSAANLALAQASNADATTRYVQQKQGCEAQIKSLVALTGMEEPKLRKQADVAFLAYQKSTPKQALLQVDKVPAQVIAQRPDVLSAQRQWVYQSAQVGVAKAALLPSLQLTGFVGRNLQGRVNSFGTDFNTWSLGPLNVTLPIFNRDSLHAQVDTAKAQLEATGLAYQTSVRNAVRDVEQALVGLQSTSEKTASSERAALAYGKSFTGVQTRYKVGLASLSELEDARRTQLLSEATAASTKLERMHAWITLYLALGGGFDPAKDYSAEIVNQHNAADPNEKPKEKMNAKMDVKPDAANAEATAQKADLKLDKKLGEK